MADGLLPYGGFSSIDVERKQEVAIHLGLLLLAIPCAPSLSHRGATGSANVASATDCQVQSDMYYGNGASTAELPIFGALYLCRNSAEWPTPASSESCELTKNPSILTILSFYKS